MSSCRKGFDRHPEARYPLIIFHGHFPHTFGGFRETPPDPNLKPEYSERFKIDGYNRIEAGIRPRILSSTGRPRTPRAFLIIEVQHANPYYDDSYAVNSANLGPYGDAIIYELIPEVEKRFRGIGQGWARFLYGGSTGGWEALGVQVFYPDEYNGCWAACPDPIDFRAYTVVNIYEHKNAYYADSRWKRTPRPGQRNYLGEVLTTLEQANHRELALGTRSRSGDQWDIWEAVFSPVGEDGYPKRIWDKLTGEIDPQVAAYWREHYDLRLHPGAGLEETRAQARREDPHLLRRHGQLLPQQRGLSHGGFPGGHRRTRTTAVKSPTATAPSTAGTATRRVRTPFPGCAIIRCTSLRSWTGSGNPRRRGPTSPPGGIRVDITLGLLPVADRTDQNHRDRQRHIGDRLRPAERSGRRPGARRADPGGAAARGVFPGRTAGIHGQAGHGRDRVSKESLGRAREDTLRRHGDLRRDRRRHGQARGRQGRRPGEPSQPRIDRHPVPSRHRRRFGIDGIMAGGLWRKRWLLEHEGPWR